MNTPKVILKHLIDISSPSNKLNARLVQFQLSDIKITYDSVNRKYIVSYKEYIINGEPTTITEDVLDENMQPVLNESGEPTTHDVIIPNITYYDSVSKEITPEAYKQMKDAITANLPTGLTEEQITEIVLVEGIKLFIIQGGYYKGKFTSQNDFE